MRTTLSISLIILSFLIASGCSNGGGGGGLDPTEDLNALLDDIIKCTMLEKQLPGLTVSIVRDGSVIYQEAFGMADIESGDDAEVDTPFAIASVTKIFTTFAVLQLIEDGLASLDDDIGEHLPDLPNDEWKQRTVRDLLSMSSGIPELKMCRGGPRDGELCGTAPFPFNDCKDEFKCEGVNRVPFGEYLMKLAPAPVQFDGGEAYFYSDTNFLILGELIEKLSGQAYEDYLDQNVLTPLGMTSTEPNTVPPPSIPELAVGYRHVTDGSSADGVQCIAFEDPPDNCSSAPPTGVMCEAIPVDELRLPLQSFSSGWLVTTQPDMVKLEQALHSLSPTLLNKESYDEMWTNRKLNDGKFEVFGLGWDVCSEIDNMEGCPRPIDPLAGGDSSNNETLDTSVVEGKVVSKDGGLQGYGSVIVRYLEDGLTVIVFVNLLDKEGALGFRPIELAAALADTVRAN